MKPTLLPCHNYSIEDSRASPRLLASSTHIRDSIGRKKNYIYSFLKPKFFEMVSQKDIAKDRTNAPIVSDKYSCLLIDEKKLVDEKIGADPFSTKESELYPNSLLIFDELKQDKVADSIITKPLPKSIKSFEFPDFLQLPGVIKNRSIEHFSDHIVSRTESQASLEPISESLSTNVSTNQKEREKSIKVSANEPVIFQKDEEATSSRAIESNVVQVAHPPPPPPPPPPPIPPPLLTTNNTSLPSLDEGRSNLMEAIRAAGGTGKVKLKPIEPKQTPIKTQEPASRMVVEDATDDLMASLQKALDKRRRGISGRADKFANLENKKRSGNSQNSVEPLSRLREVIPAPQQQQHSSMKFSSDDEDWR
uniref:WH2 domain-containing protein n=1 Tax=Acrobeloides nanus TaxID=290746 RepID=A0A914C763_9BILA